MVSNSKSNIFVIGDLGVTQPQLSQIMQDLGFGPSTQYFSEGKEIVEKMVVDGTHRSNQLPDVILLDFDLKKDGSQSWLPNIKSHTSISAVPIIVFASPEDEDQSGICYAEGAGGFLTKTSDSTILKGQIEGVLNFWLQSSVKRSGFNRGYWQRPQ